MIILRKHDSLEHVRKDDKMLEVQNLTYEVMENGKKQTIVEDVCFSVDEGEMLVITGPNGGGKSTIAKLLIGVEKATAGSISLDGKDIMPLSINERANAGIGFAFQQPPIFKGMKVRRLLSLAAGRELPEPECCTLLSNVGLCAREYIDREVDAALSGGERKRIEIASVLAKEHKMCIFDEPEAGIDLWSFTMLVKQFEEIHKSKKSSLILISHQEKIIRMADRILVVSDGKVDSQGDKEVMIQSLFEEDSCAFAQRGGRC